MLKYKIFYKIIDLAHILYFVNDSNRAFTEIVWVYYCY